MAIEVAGITAVAELTDREFVASARRIDRALQTTVRRGNRELRTFDRSFAGLQTRVRGAQAAFRALAPAIAIAAGSAGLGLAVRNATRLADTLVDTSSKLGVTTTELQELRFAAGEAGVTQNTLDLAIQRFTRRLGEAAQGSGELKDTLAQYNIQVRDSAGNTRSTVDVLGDLADVIQSAESQQERLRIAFKAFDSEGAAFVNALKDGSAGLDTFRAEARSLGIVLDEDVVEKLDEAEDSFRRLGLQLNILKAETVAPLADAFGDLAAGITEAIQGIEGFDFEAIRQFRAEGRHPFDRALGALGVGESDAEVSARVAARERQLAGTTPPRSGFLGTKQGPLGTDNDPISVVISNARPRPPGPRENFRPPPDSPIPLPVSPGFRNQRPDVRQDLRNQALFLEQAGDIQASVRAVQELGFELEDVVSALEEVDKIANVFTDSLTQGLEDAIFSGKSLREVFAGLAEDVGRQIFRSTAGKFIETAVDFGITSLLGGFGGARQHGGGVRTGQSFLVGEAGPELFVPQTPGTIIPNGVGGGGTVFNVDMRGASAEAVVRLQQLVARLNASIETRAVSAVTSARNDDPGLFR